MFQLREGFIGTKVVITRFACLSLLIASYHAFADNSETSDAQNNAAYDSLKSVQIQCFGSNVGVDGDLNSALNVLEMIASDNPEDRIHALSQLAIESAIESNSVQKILQQGLGDQDARVRAQALYALSKQNCNNADLILQQALQDSELSVRMMAVDSLVGDNENELNLLKQALDDEEQAIRELAEVKLATIAAQHKNPQ